MKVLVTGHLGFVGTHLCKALLDRGDDVIGMDFKAGGDILFDELPDADRVFHLAAQTDAQSEDAITDAMDNIIGSIRIFERYRDKCVFASSSMVHYPHSPYAISKKACEDYARYYGVRVVRFCNLYGVGGHCVIDKFREAERLTIYGGGQQLRTYAPVEDAVKLLLRARSSLEILKGKDYTVLEISSWFPGKPVDYKPQSKLDLMRAVQN
jgi:nucleoside-diphosphate-sugar epimerase